MIAGLLHGMLLFSYLCGRVWINKAYSRSVLSRFVTLYPCLMMYTALSHNTSSVPWTTASCLSICSCPNSLDCEDSPTAALYLVATYAMIYVGPFSFAGSQCFQVRRTRKATSLFGEVVCRSLSC